MTDNEIIKTLKKHSMDLCSNCKVEKTILCNNCISEIERNALDLINRQQAEIEKLNVDLVGMRGAFNYYKMHYYNAKAEIKRLKKENEILSINADTAFQDGLNEARDLYAEEVKAEIISEAIKEFAEKSIEQVEKTRQKYQRLCKEQGETRF